MADISVSVKGFNEALKEINGIATNLKPNAKAFAQKLGDIARDEAWAKYILWNVTVENIPKSRGIGNTVKATGNDSLKSHDGQDIGSIILLAEFGAGTMANDHPWASDIPMVYPGSYSETYGTGEFAETQEYWHWSGMKFEYVVPTQAMYRASQKAESEAETIIKEVFK